MAYTTINKSSEYFNTKLYTGNGSTQSITGVGFQPDWTWIKNRSTANNHRLFDVVRGANKNIKSNDSQAEITATNQLMSFDSDGFSLGDDGSVNESGSNIVSWNWLGANGTSSNTDGSMTSTVSANTTSGFSIVKWTNSTSNAGTIGHGLGVAPKMILVKTTSGTYNWYVYHKSIGAGNFLELNETVGSQASANLFDNTEPTTSVFSTGTNPAFINNTMIAYCFAEKQGFSKFGSYTGNGNADGTFIYTGFKPAFVMIKATDAIKSWMILDNKRNPTGLSGANTVDYRLTADTSGTTSDNAGGHDFYSNGFKHYSTDTSTNQSGTNYIYMAFAESPLVGINNIPATAR